MKTAMRNLIDFMQQSPMMFAAPLFMIKENNLLELEKKQIENAFQAGYSECENYQHDRQLWKEDYYNQTFNQ